MFKWLRLVWEKIRSGLMFIGKVNSILLLTVFYYLILGPVAVIKKLFHPRKVHSTTPGVTYWVKRELTEETEETLLRQF